MSSLTIEELDLLDGTLKARLYHEIHFRNGSHCFLWHNYKRIKY